MSKYIHIEPKRFCAVRKWRDGRESVEEYFSQPEEALEWIAGQAQPRKDEFVWCVGEW